MPLSITAAGPLTGFDYSASSLQGIMLNTLYGQSIPKTWSDHMEVYPVVVFQQGSNITSILTIILRENANII